MTSKTTKKHQKELDTIQDSKKKNSYDPSLQKLRVIQRNLVFVSGIPSDIATEDLLSQDLYFGRYGTIKKVIINNGQNSKKALTSQAYVTYETELQAAIAIIALDGLTMQQKPLKASFGTTKYCTHFLRSYQCLNPDCFYLHHYEPDNEVPFKSDSRTAFSDNNDYALNAVCTNLQKIIEIIVERGEDSYETEDGFPTRMEMIDFLIDSKLVNCSLIESLIAKFKSALKQTSSRESKKSKSNSFSTVASPYKQQCIEKDEVEMQKIEKQDRKQVKLEVVENQKQAQRVEQKKGKGQEQIDRKREQAQKIVEKLIIKELWNNKKGKNNRSKLGFTTEEAQKCNEKQLHKIKSIIQKHLITSV